MPLQDGIDRAPVDARALHPNVRHSRCPQPVPQRFEVPRHGAKRPHLLVRLRPRRADQKARHDRLLSSPRRPAARSGSSSSSSQASCASARAASNSRSPRLVLTPTNGVWPPPASPDASPRRQHNRGNPPLGPQETRPPSQPAQTAQSVGSSVTQTLRTSLSATQQCARGLRNAG